MFMRPCIVSIRVFQYACISNMMQHYTVYLYLETALHVSGVTSTHHQERIQLYLQHLVFVTPLLLSAAIMEELELVLSVLWVAYATHSILKSVPTLPR
jgi:predicted benzoate:H+ symporter BenE